MTTFYTLVNPIFRFLVLRFGLGSSDVQDALRILRVQGRKSGNLYDVPVRVAVMEGERYLMSMLGESQWVRNLRAAGIAQLIVGKQVEQIHATEILGEQKVAFLMWYCRHPEYEQRARFALKADPATLTPAEIDRLAHRYPVFHITPDASSERIE